MSLGGATKRGIAWALSSNLANQVLQFGVGIVLARLLAPADFGVFATTGIFTGLAATVSNIGLGSALVQRAEVEERHRRTMLTANLVSSSAIVLLLWAASPAIAAYFRTPIAGPVLRLISLNFLLNAIASVSFSMLSRALNFRVFAVTEAIGAAAFGLVAILLAARGYGVWAIAWAGVAQSLSRAVILVARAGWPLRLGWDRAALGDLLGLGAGLTLKRVINYAAANVDYAVIGRRLGPTDLGYYTRAYGLITMPLSQFSRVIMSVLFPAFSRIQSDNARIVAGYSKVVTATAIVSFPFLAGLALVAPAFMAVVYGEKWLPTVLPLTIMCVAGMMKSVTTFVGAIADAKGQVQREVKRQLIYLGILVAGTILGSRYGTAGVAWAVVVASFAMLIMMQSFLGSLTGMRWRTYLAALWPAVACTVVMTAVVVAVQAGMSRLVARTSVAMLAVSVVAGVLTYALALFAGRFPAVTALRRELERDLKELRRRRQGDARPPAAVQSSPTCQESRS